MLLNGEGFDNEHEAFERARQNLQGKMNARAVANTVTITKGKQDFDGRIDGTGYKQSMDNPAKFPLTLIPPILLKLIALVLMFGARKYARGQWMRGMSYSEVLDAIGRHWTAIVNGEDIDPETGLPHLGHIGCGIAFLAWYQYGPRWREYETFDDRLFAPREGDVGSHTLTARHYMIVQEMRKRNDDMPAKAHDSEACESPRGCA